MRQRERGATFLGIVIILLILGSALYAGIRLVPVYLEYSKVARALEQVRDEYAAIDTIGWKEIEIDKTAAGYDMIASYEAEQPFIANVYLLVKFDKTVSIPQ
jgi:hypothetical protein